MMSSRLLRRRRSPTRHSWMLEVDADGVTFEKLASSEALNQAGSHFDFATLDAKLGSALTEVFLNTVQARKRAAVREEKRVWGRQIMYLLHQDFQNHRGRRGSLRQ